MRFAVRATIAIFSLLTLRVAMTRPLGAQTNELPARVAIIMESDAAAIVTDLLTVELSSKPRLQLLEREQIQKVYREQGLSAVNTDFLKLGQVLGADGLLLLTPMSEGTNQFMQVRLVAVKPGVVLASVRSVWPVEDATGWARWLANHFDPLFPKLNVLARDAIPISVVNLRGAGRSAEAQELEQQLTLLTVDRLTRERELFVLERRRMEVLSWEKELKGKGESDFWNGSYLLEGTIDRDGYVRETVTISARLVPPKGGTPQLIEISGGRTNLAEVINRLAEKITAGLKANTNSVPWNPADEALKYFEEANWALKWGMIQQAQAASESAWALGKRDMDCALARVKSSKVQMPPDWRTYQRGNYYGNNTDIPGRTDRFIQQMSAEHHVGIAFRRHGNYVRYSLVDKPPDPKSLDQAIRMLGLYYEFSQSLPLDEPTVASPWFQLGVEVLENASRVLQHFHFVPQSQKSTLDRLAELRAQARSVVAWISKSPSVRDTYWSGDHIITRDEPSRATEEGLNFFRCKVNYGCFWQERPEDCVTLYRELVSSPMFAYIHDGLLYRQPESPRISTWNQQDEGYASELWRRFVQELVNSTNSIIVQIEGRFLQFVDAQSSEEVAESFNGLFDTIFTNRNVVVTNNVDLLHEEWGATILIGGLGYWKLGGDIYSPLGIGPLRARYNTEYRPRLQAMHDEYRAKSRERIEQSKNLAAYEKQKKYLSDNHTYEFVEFDNTFRFSKYAQTQAAELRPLLLAYKSNLTARVAGKSGLELLALRTGLGQVERVENVLKLALNPSAPAANQIASRVTTSLGPPAATNLSPQATSQPLVDGKKPTTTPQPAALTPTNALMVTRYWSPPSIEKLDCDGGLEITDVRYRLNRLWIECHCGVGNQLWIVFVVNPETLQTEGNFQIAKKSLGQPNSRVRPQWELMGDCVYVSEVDQLKKFDLRRKLWSDIPVPVQGQFSFTVAGERLYLSGKDSILEFDPKTETTKVLASSRRTPPASILDSKPAYNSPPVFSGSNGVARVLLDGKLYAYQRDRNDWVETDVMPEYQSYPQPDMLTLQRSESGVLVYFRPPYHMNHAYLMRDHPKLDVLFEHLPNPLNGLHEQPAAVPIRWKLPDGFIPPETPMDSDGNNLWLAAKPEARAAPEHLWYFGEQQPEPIPIPIRFQLQVKHPGQPGFQSDDFAVAQLRCTPAGLVLVGRAKIGSDPSRVQRVNGSVITHGSDPLAVRGATAIILDSTPQLCVIPQGDLNLAVERTLKTR